MNITKDDPLLTAYALGEVTDEERAAVERFLEENPDARAEVEEIRAAATLLTGALAEEDAPALTPEQRAALRNRLGGHFRANPVTGQDCNLHRFSTFTRAGRAARSAAAARP